VSSAPASIISPLTRLLWWVTGAGLLVWLWLSWGAFGASSWNDVRLAPVFGLKLGVPLYPDVSGLPSTWMYGPLPIWVLWPATWAADPAAALGVAGLVNLGISLAAIVAGCALTPLPHHASALPVRRLAILLCIAIWPRAAWQYIQADNLAIAVGVIANTLLLRRAHGPVAWLAAALAMAGLACKQTAVAVPLAQVLWVGFMVGGRAAGTHALRLVATAAGWGLLVLATEDPGAMWFSLMTVPGHLPWAEAPLTRLLSAAPALGVHLLLPVILTCWIRRRGEGVWMVLPTLSWALALLPGLAALFTYGGNINSLQGLCLWLPSGLTVSLAVLANQRLRPSRLILGATGIVILMTAVRIALLPETHWGLNRSRYRTATAIAAGAPGQVWFPWHPLVTIYSEQRRYADEDGLAVRALSGHAMPRVDLANHLPPHFAAIALPVGTPHWGIADELRPAGYVTAQLGEWRVDRWASAPVSTTP